MNSKDLYTILNEIENYYFEKNNLDITNLRLIIVKVLKENHTKKQVADLIGMSVRTVQGDYGVLRRV